MNRHTRKMLLNLVTGIAVAAAAAIAFLPAAQAAPGVVTSNVNVRSGPGTNYAVVTAIPSGTQVDVQRCDGGFCYVEGRRISGWVSAQYLSAGGRPVNPSNPGLSFGFNIGGNGGPNISIGIGNDNRPGRPGIFPTPSQPSINPVPSRPTPSRPPVLRPASEVCFFERTRFRGDSQCYESGEVVRDLGRRFQGYQSLENRDGLEVQVCSSRNFRDCRTYTTSSSSLGNFGDQIVSIRVR
ncbi:MAG TPA: SH3 domain-containing protein [Devosia sp.]|nr:SH3 domain-containing protein [Devosia sp.]